jgi:hypothetical protein
LTIAANERIERRLALGNGRERDAGDEIGGKILETMHGDINSPIEQCLLQFLHKHAVGAQRADGLVRALVAARGDFDERAVRAGRFDRLGYPIGLPSRQRATSGADV